MDDETPTEWNQLCSCGKRFFQPNSYTNHIRSCSRYKRGVGNSLEIAKSRWEKSAKGNKGKRALDSWFAPEDLDVDREIPSEVGTSTAALQGEVRQVAR